MMSFIQVFCAVSVWKRSVIINVSDHEINIIKNEWKSLYYDNLVHLKHNKWREGFAITIFHSVTTFENPKLALKSRQNERNALIPPKSNQEQVLRHSLCSCFLYFNIRRIFLRNKVLAKKSELIKISWT